MTLPFAAVLVGLSLVGAFIAGLLGIGGAIVMIPLLLYGPPLLGVGELEVKAVAAVTMVQVFAAAFTGMLVHRRAGAVHPRLAWIGGAAMAAGSLAGALASKQVGDTWLLVVFALMVTAAAVLMVVPGERLPVPRPDPSGTFSSPRIAGVCGGVGVAAGLVGAGGAFLLVPLLLVVVGVPLRVTIGSSLAITVMSATGGVLGKVVTAQVPLWPALTVVVGAVPGAQLGAAVSRRLSGPLLRRALLALIVVIGLRVWWNVLVR